MSSAEQIANIEEFPGGLQNGTAVRGRSLSLFRKRLRKFRTIKRGYYSFLIIVGAYCPTCAPPTSINPFGMDACPFHSCRNCISR